MRLTQILRTTEKVIYVGHVVEKPNQHNKTTGKNFQLYERNLDFDCHNWIQYDIWIQMSTNKLCFSFWFSRSLENPKNLRRNCQISIFLNYKTMEHGKY